jgi:hypothetical protein
MTSSEDPDRIRAEIENTQATLSRDVDALTDKVSPGRIVERRVDRVRGAFGRAKEAVMGSHDTPGTPGTIGYGTGRSSSHGTGHGTGHDLAGAASHAASSVSSTASSAASSVADAAQQAPQAVRRQARGNPLAAGLVAFGAGLLVSSLLPATRREQELASQARDRAQELSGPVTDAAKQVANEMRENLQEPAQQAVEAVRGTATEAGRTVADDGRSAAEHVQGQAKDTAQSVRGS